MRYKYRIVESEVFQRYYLKTKLTPDFPRLYYYSHRLEKFEKKRTSLNLQAPLAHPTTRAQTEAAWRNKTKNVSFRGPQRLGCGLARPKTTLFPLEPDRFRRLNRLFNRQQCTTLKTKTHNENVNYLTYLTCLFNRKHQLKLVTTETVHQLPDLFKESTKPFSRKALKQFKIPQKKRTSPVGPDGGYSDIIPVTRTGPQSRRLLHYTSRPIREQICFKPVAQNQPQQIWPQQQI